MSKVAVSIVIPVFNGAHWLPSLLDHLDPWMARPDVEVLFVDDASTDDSRALLAASEGARIEAMSVNSGPAAARNRGVAAAKGDVIFFLDADVLPAPDGLDRVLAWRDEHPEESGLIGSYDADPEHPALVSQFKNLFHHHVHQTSAQDAGTFWTGCGAVRRDAFLSVGGFDAKTYRKPAIEDIDLGVRLRQGGARMRLDAALQVKHRKEWTLLELIRTDIFQRGIPWTHLCLRTGEMRADLNLRWSHRIAVISSWLFLGACVSAFFIAPANAGWMAAVLGGVWVTTQVPILAAFARIRSPGFALRCVPLFFLYSLYCAVAFGLGVVTYPWSAGRRTAVGADPQG